MTKNHIKLLTENQRIEFKNRYNFELDKKSNEIVVRLSTYNKVTRHEFGKTFTINARNLRRLSFTPEAQEYWSKLPNEHLVDVQHAVNILTVTYQQLSFEAVKRTLISFGKVQTN